MDFATAGRIRDGESVSGDRAVAFTAEDRATFAVIDGLGHGQEAATAGQIAAETIEANRARTPAEHIQGVHRALHGTRGAVLAVVVVHLRTGDLQWASVGNIETMLIDRAGRRLHAVQRGGIVGFRLPSVRDRVVSLEDEGVLVMATDGVGEGFTDGMTMEPRDQLASELIAEHAAGTDDALVLTVRLVPGVVGR